MKKFLLAVAAVIMLAACGGNGSGNSPVDEILSIIDQNKEVFLSESPSDLDRIGEKLEAIVEANKDYVLTKADKKKLVKEIESFVDFYVKNMDKDDIKEAKDMGVDIAEVVKLQLKTYEKGIEDCETLGDLTEENFGF